MIAAVAAADLMRTLAAWRKEGVLNVFESGMEALLGVPG
jgi:hypothetical protein